MQLAFLTLKDRTNKILILLLITIFLLAALAILLFLEIRFRQHRFDDIVASQQMHLMAGYSGFMQGGIIDLVAEGRNPAPSPVEALLAKGSMPYEEAKKVDLGLKTPSPTGLFKPNDSISFWWFKANGAIRHENTYHLNNHGLISVYDYSIERMKRSFRIAILGDELTAATTADKSWPDHLQEMLNQDGKTASQLGPVEVINFGWPDAGFHVMHREWLEKARRFKPDFAILNFAEHSFVRMPTSHIEEVAPSTAMPKTYLEPFEAPNGLRAWMVLFCYGEARRLRDLGCLAGRPFGLFLPRELARDADALAAVQESVLRDYLGRLIWADWRLTFLLDMFGELDDPLKARVDGGSQRRPSVPPPSIEQKLENARSNIAGIRSGFKNLLVLQSRNYAELVPRPSERPLSRALRLNNPDLKVVDMADYLPLGSGDPKAWFQVPFAAEKWSNLGHEVYARAVADVLRLRLKELGFLPTQ